MYCRYCGSEMEDNEQVCPSCGKEQVEKPAPKKKWPLIAGIVGAVLALVVLAGVLLQAMGVDVLPRANDIFKKDSYTVSDEKAVKNADQVVATIGDKELTNAQLMIYYRTQIIDFVNYYGSYLSNIGLDTNKPLSEQSCYFQDYEDYTWQQYFLEMALQTWENYQLLGLLAEENGFTLSEAAQEALEKFPEDLQKQAEDGKYADADAMIEDAIGVGCDAEEYMKFVRLAYLSGEFHASESKRLTPNDADVEAYFTENAESFQKNGITKESGLYSAVRHILVSPKGGTVNEETNETTYSEAEWAACLKEAEGILEEWKKGKATAESFGELATKYTTDGGSKSTGGLYEGIYKGSGMVAEFEAWAIDGARKPGDTGIVKTQFGYHIMYFVEGEQNWFRTAKVNLLGERTTELVDSAAEKWPMEVKYGKIAMADIGLN